MVNALRTSDEWVWMYMEDTALITPSAAATPSVTAIANARATTSL
jgi:hypothetical protein